MVDRPGPRPPGQVDRLVDQLLEPQPLPQRGRQHQPGVGDRALVIEHGPQRIELHNAVSAFTI